MAQIFDRYWNSEVVYPIEAVGEPLGDKAARAKAFDATIAALPPSPPIDPPSTDLLGYGPLAEELDSGQLGLEWGIARAFADPPEKLLAMTPKIAFEMSVTNDVMMQVWQAKNDLVLDVAVHDPGRDRDAVVRATCRRTRSRSRSSPTRSPRPTSRSSTPATRATARACSRPASTSTS